MKEQYTKLDEILSAHANSIKSMLERNSDTDKDEVYDKFVDELLVTTTTFSSSLPTFLPNRKNIDEGPDTNKSFSNEETTLDSLENDLQQILAATSSGGSSSSSSGSKTGTGTCTSASATTSSLGSLGTSLFMKPARNPDELSLAGLLNVLDGVVDTPGRIVIMTTNHPEMLDPALIRPARVDNKLLLSYMSSIDVITMLEHYFQIQLTMKQKERIELAINGPKTTATSKTSLGTNRLLKKMTPAQVEQLSVEYDDIEDMIKALEN